MKKKHLASLVATASAIGVMTWASMSSSSYPLHTLPPTHWGVTNPDITQANINQNICNPHWSTKLIRPRSTYTTLLKKRQLTSMDYSDKTTASYEEDHLISLELGGSPNDPMNLWPEPYTNTVAGQDLGAHAKDKVENYLHAQVCSGAMTLAEAQEAIKTNWVTVLAKMKGYNATESDSDNDD